MAADGKTDRRARLVFVEHLLYQNQGGIHPKKIAEMSHVSLRTTYRDLLALQTEINLPIWEYEGRYGLKPGHFLPPIKLTLLEAMALFISARLVSKYADESDPNIESAFVKLASVLPPPIAQHIQETVATMADKPENQNFVRVFDVLTTAWANCRRVRIRYPRLQPDGSVREVFERLLDPYFIEPSATGHACYAIGYDHHSNQIRTFKVERISGIELTAEEFTMPSDWSAREYLRGSWGIVHDEEVEVKVRFSSRVASRVKESIWHESQALTDEPDGALLFAAKISGTMEIVPWLLSWGAEAEILAPLQLRAEFAEIVRQQAAIYASSPVEDSLSLA